MGEVRKNGGSVRIVPRVLFEGWNMNDYQKLFGSKSKKSDLAKFLSDELTVSDKRRMKIDNV